MLFLLKSIRFEGTNSMPIKIDHVDTLKDYFTGVVERSEHHAPNVSEIIYPLLGLLILTMDNHSDIQVRSYGGSTGNILWFSTNNQRYAFRYEHDGDFIELRKDKYTGEVVAKLDNMMTICDLKAVFKAL